MTGYKTAAVLLSCLWLAGCQTALPSEAYRPANPDFYKSLPKKYALKGKISVGKVTNDLPDDGAVTAAAFRPALIQVLSDAGLVAPKKADYVLSARIKDYRWPSTGMTKVTGGAAVAYTLLEAGTGRVVYRKTVTSRHEEGKFLLDTTERAMWNAVGRALGENAAQLTRELVKLRPVKDPEARPLNKLEGAL